MSSETAFPSGDAAHDAVAIKYLSTAVGTILLYDYLLTFSDEVRFLWNRERRGWAFYLFLFNRYCPILYEVWSRCVLEDFRKCESTFKIHGVSFLLFLLSGQVVTIARLYVFLSHRRLVLPATASIVLAQLVIGLIAVFSSHASAITGASVNTPALQLCFFSMGSRMGYVYIGLSLLFDVALFLRIAIVVRKALLYSVVMVFSHMTMLLFEVFGPDPLKVAPTLTVTIISPVMVSRMVLSLARLTASSQQFRWEMDHFTIDSVDSVSSQSIEMAPICHSSPSQGEHEA